MIEIIPAILPKSFDELEEKMSLVTGLVPMVQVDITDGHFVPSKTWPYTSGATPNADKHFDDILAEQEDFPFLDELDFEVDLMVANPENVWRDWVHAGAKRIIIHAESVKGFGSAEHAANILELLRAIQKEIPSRSSLLHVEVGVAINPSTSNEIITPLLTPLMDEIDFVQFMGIERIGFQGEKFDERVLTKISDLRTQFPNATISVDGGVTSETAPRLIAAGANRLAVGSAIFGGAHENITSEEISVALDEIFAVVQ